MGWLLSGHPLSGGADEKGKMPADSIYLHQVVGIGKEACLMSPWEQGQFKNESVR